MKYPSNPKTNLKEEYETLRKQRQEEIEWEQKMAEKREKGREEYLKQLKQLSVANGRGGGVSDVADSNGGAGEKRRGWFGWLRWNGGDDSVEDKRSSER